MDLNTNDKSCISPDVRDRRARSRLSVLGTLLLVLSGSIATAEQNGKNVLVLFSAVDSEKHFLDVVEPEIRARIKQPVTFYQGYLENDRDAGPENWQSYQDSQAETFRRTYEGVKLDLVIALSPQAVLLAVKHHDQMIPGVPIVYSEVSNRFPVPASPATTGLTVSIHIKETIDLALRLNPKTRTVAIVSGEDWETLNEEHAELLRYRDRVKVVDFIGPASREMLTKVEALPADSVVLFHISPGSARSEFGGWELLDAVAKRLPTYSEWPLVCLNHGCIGGAYSDTTKQYLSTAELATRVLEGERPEDIPVVHDNSLQYTVDWRALQRWHIPESMLPENSLVLYREPTFWERDRKYLTLGVGLIAVQTLLIAGLLWQRARKRKAEAVLRESEERFRIMADTTPSLIWMCDAQGKITYLNEQWLAFSGSDPHSGYGDTWIGYVHPDDVQHVLEALWQAVKDRRSFSKEYRVRRADGVYRWMFDVASPRINGDGSLAGFIGSAIDVTDQKLAQQALEKVSGQLIEAQEKERSRIARELHDDICQRLALLSMEMEQAKRAHNDPDAAARSWEEIRQRCGEITNDVQSLSHQLHSSRLDYLGITVALRGFCEEFSKKHGVNVNFRENDVPGNVPDDVSLGLFRVAQEALHNSVKYSGAKEFKVELCRIEDNLQLTVMDTGVGFDVQKARGKGGLGLLSMQERINLIRGKLTIESAPGAGTKVVASVPIVVEESLIEDGAFKLDNVNANEGAVDLTGRLEFDGDKGLDGAGARGAKENGDEGTEICNSNQVKPAAPDLGAPPRC